MDETKLHDFMGKLVTDLLYFIPSAYTQLIADIGNLRSSGIRDLGHADLRHEDRTLARSPWELRKASHPVPLLPGIDMSSTITSGVSACAASIAARPLDAVPTIAQHVRSTAVVRASMAAWSSTRSTLSLSAPDPPIGDADTAIHWPPRMSGEV